MERIVQLASLIQDVKMELASDHGNAIATQDGMECFATQVSVP